MVGVAAIGYKAANCINVAVSWFSDGPLEAAPWWTKFLFGNVWVLLGN